jgi:hypothetical protein
LSADINKRGFAEGGSIDDAVANRKYIIDPVTGNVILNPNIRRPAPRTFANMGSFGRKDDDSGRGDREDPNPDFDTPEKQAAFYADPKNAVFADITRAGQTAFGFAPRGIGSVLALQNYLDPGFRQEKEALTRGTVIDIGSPISSPNIRGTPLGEPDGGTRGDGGSTEGSPGLSMGSNPDGSGNAAGANAATAAQGGLMSLAKGGMKSGGFVVPADVVSMIGEGNTDAGYKRIKSMVPSAVAIKGKDGGQSDTVKTSIEGKQRARVAHGEMYIPPETVKRMGGAKKLYAMMDRVRQQATGSKRQIKPVSLKRAMA